MNSHLLLEKGKRQNLLDLFGSNTEFSAEVDATEVWREPLQAMLLSRSSEQIAKRMMETGHLYKRSNGMTLAYAVQQSGEAPIGESMLDSDNAIHNLGTNISKWASGQVYGPGDMHHLLALIEVLVECGYIQIDSSPKNSARKWFKHLEKLRAGRRAAGMNLTNQLDRLLDASLQTQPALSDGQELLLDNGTLVSVHKLAMISDQVSAVPESLLKTPV